MKSKKLRLLKVKQQRTVASIAAGIVCLSINSASAATLAYRSVVLGDSPVVYYEFDETSGTESVNSATTGATYTGTFNTSGGSITVGQSSFTQGGTAYNFGGGFIGAASALTSSLDEWTVEAWVNYDSAKVSSSTIISNDQGGWNNDVLIGVLPETASDTGLSNGEFGVSQQGSPGSTRDVAGAALAADTWAHLAVVGSTSAGTLTVFINGLQVAQDASLVNGVTFNGADGIGTANLTIGAARPNSADTGYRPFDGLLDELAIYDSVLDATTIDAHYNAGIAAIPEPSSTALIGLGGLSLIMRRRR